MFYFFLLLLLKINFSVIAQKYNILILTSPVGSRSHSIYFNGIAKELAGRGHQVVQRCAGKVEEFEGVRNFVHPESVSEDFLNKVALEGDTLKGIFELTFNVSNVLINAIRNTYNEPLLQNLIANSSPNTSKFDLVLVDAFLGCLYLPLAKHIGALTMLITSTALHAPYAWHLNFPYFYHFNYYGFSEPTHLFSRTKNFMFHLSTLFVKNFLYAEKANEEIRKFIPNAIRINNLVKNASFVLTGNPPAIQDSVPTASFVVDAGCVHCRPARPLSKELELVMEKSGDHGVIYFSLGSFVNFDWFPEEFQNKLISVLSNLPQVILFKGRLNRTDLSNFYFADWFPQQDLLGHPKLRLIINNGGLGTMQEAAYHGCAMLGFPLNVDHYYSMRVAKKNGFGEHLLWRHFTAQELNHTILNILNDKTYKKKALAASVRLKDRMELPVEIAAYWIEYVIRHKGANFLNAGNKNLNWYQYFLVDVSVLIIFFAIVFACIVYCAILIGFRLIRTLAKF